MVTDFFKIFNFSGSQECHNTKQGYTECRAVCGCFGNMSSNETICCNFPDKKPTNFCSNGGKTEEIKAKIEQGNQNIKNDNSILRTEFIVNGDSQS